MDGKEQGIPQRMQSDARHPLEARSSSLSAARSGKSTVHCQDPLTSAGSVQIEASVGHSMMRIDPDHCYYSNSEHTLKRTHDADFHPLPIIRSGILEIRR